MKGKRTLISFMITGETPGFHCNKKKKKKKGRNKKKKKKKNPTASFLSSSFSPHSLPSSELAPSEASFAPSEWSSDALGLPSLSFAVSSDSRSPPSSGSSSLSFASKGASWRLVMARRRVQMVEECCNVTVEIIDLLSKRDHLRLQSNDASDETEVSHWRKSSLLLEKT